jgi:hypothetical protein
MSGGHRLFRHTGKRSTRPPEKHHLNERSTLGVIVGKVGGSTTLNGRGTPFRSFSDRWHGSLPRSEW